MTQDMQAHHVKNKKIDELRAALAGAIYGD